MCGLIHGAEASPPEAPNTDHRITTQQSAATFYRHLRFVLGGSSNLSSMYEYRVRTTALKNICGTILMGVDIGLIACFFTDARNCSSSTKNYTRPIVK